MIIDKNNLEVWMISLIGNHHADAVRTVTIPKWRNQGFTINLFNAIIPDEIQNISEQLKFGLKHRKFAPTIEFTETEKAVWYSHFCLWEKCLDVNKPFLILEEDTKPKRLLPDKFEVSNLFRISAGGSGYILLPTIVKKMIKNSTSRKITYNVDYYIERFKDKNSTHYAMQVERGMRSISHN